MSIFTFRGFIAPVFTPFNDDASKSLNLSVIPSYSQYLADANISGVLVNGTYGEGTSMTISERKSVTEAWALACSETHQHLMVQVGGAAFPDVIEMAKHAEALKANSILCLPDLFHKPPTCKELIRYLKLVSEAAPKTPLLYYHIPSFTEVNLDMGVLLAEVGTTISTFAGILFSSTVLDEGLSAVISQDRKYAVFLGVDLIMAGAFIQGFDSVIATTLNIFPEHALHIFELMSNGNVENAKFIQSQLNTAIKCINKHGSQVTTMKEAMNFLTPIAVGTVRPPLMPLTVQQIQKIKDELEELKIIEFE